LEGGLVEKSSKSSMRPALVSPVAVHLPISSPLGTSLLGVRNEPLLQQPLAFAISKLSGYSNHINVRDKSVKVMQYAARVIANYHIGLSQEEVAIMRNVTFICSMARKVFRLGKSINCLNELMGKLANNNNAFSVDRIPKTVQELAFCLELLEQVFLSIFFLTDHALFFGRAKLVANYDPQRWEPCNYSFWFLYESTTLFRKVILFADCWHELYHLESAADSLLSPVHTTPTRAQQVQDSRRRELKRQARRLSWELFRSFCDVGVSGGFFARTDAGQRLIKQFLPFMRSVLPTDGAIGIMGVLSASMVVIDSASECK